MSQQITLDVRVSNVILTKATLSAVEDHVPKILVNLDADDVTDFVSGERFDRPYNTIRKVLPEVLRTLGIEYSPQVKFRWRQNCGCSCGCSPGFFVDNCSTMKYDVHLFYKRATQQSVFKEFICN